MSQSDLERLKARRPEREALGAILRYLRLVPGCTVWRNNVGAITEYHEGKKRHVQFGFPGLPDLEGWLVMPGLSRVCYRDCDVPAVTRLDGHVHPVSLPLFVEVKGGRGWAGTAKRRRALQQTFLTRARADGCVAFMATTAYDCQRELRALGVLAP